MLLRVGFANHYSVRDYREMSLVASTAIKDHGNDLIDSGDPKVRLLPIALIYGANAAGKSNIFLAAQNMRRHVVNSFSSPPPGGKVHRVPFALDKSAREKPSRFDCDFIIDNVRYHFGFEASDERYTREWLFSYPEGSRRLLYNRDVENPEIEFGKTLKGKNKTISEITRPNSLFLSAAAQGAHAQLTPIYEYFLNKLIFISPSGSVQETNAALSVKVDPRVISFLSQADTGIVSARVEHVAVSQERRDMLGKFQKAIATLVDNDDFAVEIPDEEANVSFAHAGEDSEPVYLELNEESRGTIRLAYLLTQALKVIDNGGTLFVDELDESLHTLLAREFMALFSKTNLNTNGAQLVATIHDTNMLTVPALRRDQIWFTEKSSIGQTDLYPLTDVQTRRADNLEKGYLQGRFGAIPFFGSLDTLLEGSD